MPRRRMMITTKRVPSQYEEVARIRTNRGYVTLDTSLLLDENKTLNNIDYEVVLAFHEFTTSSTTLYGVLGYWDFYRTETLSIGIQQDLIVFCRGSHQSPSWGALLAPVSLNVEYRLKTELNKCYIDGIYVGDYTGQNSGDCSSIKFYLGSSSVIAQDSTFGEVVLKKYGVEVIHLVPCKRKSDNSAGFYDILNGVYYTNYLFSAIEN